MTESNTESIFDAPTAPSSPDYESQSHKHGSVLSDGLLLLLKNCAVSENGKECSGSNVEQVEMLIREVLLSGSSEVQKLQNDVARFSTSNDTMKAKIELLETELNESYKSNSSEMFQLKESHDQLLNELQNNIKMLNGEIQLLKEQSTNIDTVVIAKDEAEEREQKLKTEMVTETERLNQDLETKIETINKLEIENSNAKNDLQNQVELLHHFETEIRNVKESISNLEEENIKNSIDQKTTELTSENKKLANIKNSIDQKTTELTSENKKLANEISQLKNKLKSSDKELKNQQEKNEQLKKEKVELENAKLKSKYLIAASHPVEVPRKSETVSKTAEAEIASLKEALKKMERENEAAEKTIENLRMTTKGHSENGFNEQMTNLQKEKSEFEVKMNEFSKIMENEKRKFESALKIEAEKLRASESTKKLTEKLRMDAVAKAIQIENSLKEEIKLLSTELEKIKNENKIKNGDEVKASPKNRRRLNKLEREQKNQVESTQNEDDKLLLNDLKQHKVFTPQLPFFMTGLSSKCISLRYSDLIMLGFSSFIILHLAYSFGRTTI